MEPSPEAFALSVVWPGIQDMAVAPANVFLGQVAQTPMVDGAPPKPDSILLSIGYLVPPILLGTPQEQQASARAIGAVAVHPIARLALSRTAAMQLRIHLDRLISGYDEAEGLE